MIIYVSILRTFLVFTEEIILMNFINSFILVWMLCGILNAIYYMYIIAKTEKRKNFIYIDFFWMVVYGAFGIILSIGIFISWFLTNKALDDSHIVNPFYYKGKR